jgi:hypothetical protein
MKKTTSIIFAFSLLSTGVCKINAQDFQFKWSISTFCCGGYSVAIERNHLKRNIQFTKLDKQPITLTKRISKKDCDSLFDFLLGYNFTLKGSTITHTDTIYFDTISLPDKERVIINDEIHRKELLDAFGYYPDAKSNRYYNISMFSKSWTDGTNYNGEFFTNNAYKKYDVYCKRLDKSDFKLNMLIFDLLSRYYENVNLMELKKEILNDKPNDIIIPKTSALSDL